MTQVNAIGWFDIYVEDMDRAVNFYQTILNVELIPLEDPTGESVMRAFPMTDESMSQYGALGALTKTEHSKPGPGGTIVYFNSQDCSVEESRIVDAGGVVIRPKFSIGEFGFVSVCQDTEGNIFGFNSMK